MISRREKLLLRPWEQRRYDYHRKQVQSALPAIDVGPPANHIHVEYKRKKHQKELERCSKIEKDNCKLLQRLSRLMSTSRVDNTWRTAQPNFLNRVSIYKTGNKSGKSKDSSLLQNEIMEEKTRKERCSACTPKKSQEIRVPEERIPWDPPKPAVSHRRSQSLPPRKVQIIDPRTPAKSRKTSLAKTPEKTPSQSAKLKKPSRARSSRSVVRSNKNGRIHIGDPGQSITFSRGDIRLAIRFPGDTEVKLKDGVSEKIIIDGLCQCKAMKI